MRDALMRWRLSVKVLPLAVLVVGLKWALHSLGKEFLSMNMLFSGLLAATVFLLGFMISGVLADYKESEKLPGEIASSLEAIWDELDLRASTHPEPGREALRHLHLLSHRILDWFHQRLGFTEVLEALRGLNTHFHALESAGVPPPYLARLKGEQGALRRALTRVRVVRETSFIGSGYAVADLTATLLLAGFILAKIEPFTESLFFVGVISFMLIYLLALIRDIDDPFEYNPDGSSGGGDEISLFPIQEVEARLSRRVEEIARP